MEEEKKRMEEKEIALSWALDAIKDVLGTQSIRNKIVNTFFPSSKNSRYMKTFDAFQQYSFPPFNEKEQEILQYCKEIMQLKNYVVFTATNIQEEENDNETHYQTYIVDNTNKQLYVIDPAIDPKKKKGYGIYKPMVTYNTIQPFFVKHGYQFQYIKLTNPAQVSTEDVFCQSWSLYILLEVLKKGISGDTVIDIPKKQIDKYELLLNFYKQILIIETISDKLNSTYCKNVKKNKSFIKKTANFKNVLEMNASDIILEMNATDLQV